MGIKDFYSYHMEKVTGFSRAAIIYRRIPCTA